MGREHHHPKAGEAAAGPGGLKAGERRRLAWVLVLTGATMVAEIVGGVLTHSVSLLSDAFHMLTHLGAVGVAWLAIRAAMAPAAPERTFRNWRLEVIGSLVNGALLVPIAVYVLVEAWHRFRNPVPVEVGPMLAVAAGGLVVNLACAAFLHGHSHDDLNLRGAFVHLVADSVSSVGVLAAGALIWWGGPRYTWADPAAAALISLLILVWSAGLARSSLRILLEAAPAHVELDEVRAAMEAHEGVAGVHDLHVWTITSKMHALTAHVVLERDLPVSEAEELGRRMREELDRRFDINHATLQFEAAAPERLECAHDPE